MKIAIPSDEGTYLSQHFGRTLGFTIVEIDNNRIVGKEYRQNSFTGHALGLHHENRHHGEGSEGHGQHSHGRILNALHDCEVVIAGGMGHRLYNDLITTGKRIYVTTQPEISKAVEMFLADELKTDKDTCHHP